jgi:hypothetical protein
MGLLGVGVIVIAPQTIQEAPGKQKAQYKDNRFHFSLCSFSIRSNSRFNNGIERSVVGVVVFWVENCVSMVIVAVAP